MTTHPSSLDLEAWACGDAEDAIASHLDECEACKSFVDRLKGAVSKGPSFDFTKALASAAAPAEEPGLPKTTEPARPTVRPLVRVISISTIVVPLALAAAVLLFLRRTEPNDLSAETAPIVSAPPTAVAMREPDPETTFKGSLQVAVIRERSGVGQSRFLGKVKVKEGDRLRLEVALDREQAIVGGVIGDDGSYLELMPNGVRGAGTHFSEKSARIDATPTSGTIIIGTPEAVARARATKSFEGVTAVRVEMEP